MTESAMREIKAAADRVNIDISSRADYPAPDRPGSTTFAVIAASYGEFTAAVVMAGRMTDHPTSLAAELRGVRFDATGEGEGEGIVVY